MFRILKNKISIFLVAGLVFGTVLSGAQIAPAQAQMAPPGCEDPNQSSRTDCQLYESSMMDLCKSSAMEYSPTCLSYKSFGKIKELSQKVHDIFGSNGLLDRFADMLGGLGSGGSMGSSGGSGGGGGSGVSLGSMLGTFSSMGSCTAGVSNAMSGQSTGQGASVIGTAPGVTYTQPGGVIASEMNVTGLYGLYDLFDFMIETVYKECILNDLFKGHILPAMMLMTEQLSAVGMQQVAIIGSFFDVKNQLETQRLLQEMTAEAHKDYQPSDEMCTMGTLTRSLYSSERNATLTTYVLSGRSLDRQVGNVNASAAAGPGQDRKDRVNQFLTRYCDPNDDDGGVGRSGICLAGTDPNLRELRNKDINFTRTVGTPLTLDVNFSNGSHMTGDEQDILALAANLFSHDIFPRFGAGELKDASNQERYLDRRSIIAKRSVAEYSFYSILGLKANGADNSDNSDYMRALVNSLGVPMQDMDSILGRFPSYYAQMEFLTKTLFQRPEFYIDLYDKPANVARKGVTLQAIGLMQDRDLYKSSLRSEALLSVLLEMEIMKAQEAMTNRQRGIGSAGISSGQ